MMMYCAALLMAAVQLSCVSQRTNDAHRAVASEEKARFDGTYALAAVRCGVGRDQTQVQADMFALRAAQKSRGVLEVETGHSHLTLTTGYALTIGGGHFTYALPGRCQVKNVGELEERGDDAILRKTGAESCAGESVALTTTPEVNVSAVSFVGEYLVEDTATRCMDGRDFQRVWLPAQSF